VGGREGGGKSAEWVHRSVDGWDVRVGREWVWVGRRGEERGREERGDLNETHPSDTVRLSFTELDLLNRMRL
jgi:hypothetical protein